MEAAKPIKVRPIFYSVCLQGLQEIAKGMGYNLLVHGSMNRDMDLVAIPWIDKPESHLDLIKALDYYLRGVNFDFAENYMHTILPGGRNSYVINLNRGGYTQHPDAFKYKEDEQYYLDISITPLVESIFLKESREEQKDN
jgi:hypothetical protein